VEVGPGIIAAKPVLRADANIEPSDAAQPAPAQAAKGLGPGPAMRYLPKPQLVGESPRVESSELFAGLPAPDFPVAPNANDSVGTCGSAAEAMAAQAGQTCATGATTVATVVTEFPPAPPGLLAPVAVASAPDVGQGLDSGPGITE